MINLKHTYTQKKILQINSRLKRKCKIFTRPAKLSALATALNLYYKFKNKKLMVVAEKKL